MKKLVAVVGLLMAVAGSASAQGGGGGMGGGQQMSPEARDSVQLSRLFTGITLNADQTAKAKKIITDARVALAALDRQAADFRDKMTEANGKRNADLKALLTADADKTKFDENAAAAGRGRRGGGL